MNPEGRPVPGILVAHGRLAAELKLTAESIGGPAPDLLCLSNVDRRPEELSEDIGAAIDERGPGTVVLVDLAGGSCCTAALRAARTRPKTVIVAGINLALLLDFLSKREDYASAELVTHMTERGHSGLKVVKAGE